MAYYHLTRAQQYIHSLGFSNSNHPKNGIDDRPQVAVADAFQADNSFYSPFTRQIKYGSGGVDDAEDADVILHEYGHAMQDSESRPFLASRGFQPGGLGAGPGTSGRGVCPPPCPGPPTKAASSSSAGIAPRSVSFLPAVTVQSGRRAITPR